MERGPTRELCEYCESHHHEEMLTISKIVPHGAKQKAVERKGDRRPSQWGLG